MSVHGHGAGLRELRGALFGAAICWVAPTSGVASSYWRSVKAATREVWTDKSEKERRIALLGGGSVVVRSGQEPDSLRGPTLDGVIIDEAGFQKPEVMMVLEPALAVRSGWLALLSTPPKHQNRYARIVLKRDETDAVWSVWQRPSTDNPLFTEIEAANQRTLLGLVDYRREIQAELVFADGSFWKYEHFERRWLDESALPSFLRVILVVDSAWKTGIAHDFSVIACWATDGVDYYLLDLWRGKVASPDLKMRIVDQYNKHNPSKVYIEQSSSGFAAGQELQRSTALPIELVPATASKIARVEAVIPLGDSRKIVIPAKAVWVDGWVVEHVEFTGAADGVDDQVDTTSLALSVLKKGLRIARGRSA